MPIRFMSIHFMPLRSGLRGFAAASLIAAAIAAVSPGLAQEPVAPPPAVQKDPAAEDRGARFAEAMEPLKLNIEQMEAQLQRDDLNDAALVRSRGSLEPVRDELREMIASLERRLGDVDTRLKQIGDPPAAGAPAEEAGIAAERSRLQERRTALDGWHKQARLLMLRADDLSERITERRRALFTRELLGRTSSAVSPGFWSEAGRAVPDALRGVVLLSQGWLGYALASASGWTMAAAFLTLVAFSVFAFLFLRWFERRALAPRRLETRFSKSLYALLTMLRIALTAPAVVAAAVLILDAFGLMPERFMNIGFGLAAAFGIAAFGRGVAVGLFAVDNPDRRLISIRDEVAQLVASHLVWAARVLGVIVFLNIVQQAIVAPVSLTVATSAIFAILIAAILCHFLFRVGRSDVPDDEISGVGWLRAGGWLLVIGIVAALLTGFIGLAAFLAGRFLVALGALGALYVFLAFIDALFTDVLSASTPRGKAIANFFGLKPRTIELLGTLLSAALRILLVLVVLLPLLGPWGIFAADFFGVVRDATFGLRIGEVTISFTTIFTAFATILIGILATRAVQRWLSTQFLPRTALDSSLQNSVSTIFGYIGVIAALSLALAQLGVDFQKITLVAGALSIGIGFGLQSVVSNFVSGLILLAERPIRVGDIISVKGEEGRVLRIHVRATEIETGDRSNVIIPNSELITQVVKNRTYTDTFARVMVPVGVAYGSDVAKVRDILLDIAKSHPHVMPMPAPTVFLTGFGESAINFELGWLVRNIGDGPGIKSDICFSILERFQAEGIVMPFPQRNIRIEGLEPDDPADIAPPAPKKPKGR
jgi:small-conductance mechanosensitive channel